MSIRKSIGKIASAGGLIALLYGSGCVDPPKNGQYYTKSELDNQREIRNIVSLGGFLFDFAAPISTNPAKAFAVGSAINTANNVAGYNDPLRNQQGNAQERIPKQPRVLTTYIPFDEATQQWGSPWEWRTEFTEGEHICVYALDFPEDSLLTLKGKDNGKVFYTESRRVKNGQANWGLLSVDQYEPIFTATLEIEQDGKPLPDKALTFSIKNSPKYTRR